MSTTEYLIPFSEWYTDEDLPFAGIVTDLLPDLLITPVVGTVAGLRLGFYVGEAIEFRIGGLDDVRLVIAGGALGTILRFDVGLDPFSITLRVPITLRVASTIFREVDTSNKPINNDPFCDVDLGEIDVSIDIDGHLNFDIGAASLPRCMIGTSGVVVEIGALKWLTPSTPSVNRPPNTPSGFTGLYLDDVEVEITGLPKGVNALRLDDGFIGTGGFSGKITNPNLNLDWDTASGNFTGALHGELFGFKGGLSSVGVEFRQNALVGCDIAGDVYVPWVEKVIGLELGITGSGTISALARVPHSPGASGVTAGTGNHLLHVAIGGVMDINLDSIHFVAPVGAPAFLEISGSIGLDPSTGIDLPAVGVKALRIDTDGHVAIDGGWLDVPDGKIAPFHGFPLEISRIGFGSEGTGASKRIWFGLNGGLKLADGLPVGASVEGLKLSWAPENPAGTLAVTLAGIGLELDIPKVVKFSGSVSFFDDGSNKGFRGHGHLSLPTVGLGIDADLVVGRMQSGDTFFYFHVGVDLPVGIPLFSTGAAFYGFEGLIANNMGPDRRNGEPWYWGWYVREPRGATNQAKWAVQSGAFAAGLGTTIGTLPDTAFTINAKVLFILILPGPVLMLEGKGSFLRKKPTGNEEGIFEALLALDVPGKTFTTNLAVTYNIEKLLKLHGGADIGFSWASPQPPHMWHLYLGEDTPKERRWTAELLSLFHANSYYMLERTGIRVGAWVGFDEDWNFGPVHVWAKAEIYGEGMLSWAPPQFMAHLHLGGEAGISAFGAKIVAGASADVLAEGPTPWHVHFDIEAYIEIDLLLFSFEFSVTIPLDWREPVDVLPEPALPLVERVAHQHLVVDENGDLESALIAADAKPVVVFHRPVRDLGRIGMPAAPVRTPEIVGPRKFAYNLAHVALHRRDGAGWKVVAASGALSATGASVSLPGSLLLESAENSTIEIDGSAQKRVTASASGSLTLDSAVTSGASTYRLRGPRATVDVSVATSTPLGAGLVSLQLAATPGIGRDELGGGTLVVGPNQWAIAGNQGSVIVVRTNATAPVLPHIGPAQAFGPLGPVLEGAWMPDDRGDLGTKLMIGARTPFAQFNNNSSTVIDGWNEHNPDYACGPVAIEDPFCVDFDSLDLGIIDKTDRHVDRLTITGSGDVMVVPAQGTHRVIRIGNSLGDRSGSGTVRIVFNEPVEQVWIHYSTNEGGVAVASREGSVVGREFVKRDNQEPIRFHGEIDQVDIEGSTITLYEVCFIPGWTCTGFVAASFPQRSTGKSPYAGLEFESAGVMTVRNDILVVAVPSKAGFLAAEDLLTLKPIAEILAIRGIAARSLSSMSAGPSNASSAEPITLVLPGLDQPAAARIPGIGLVAAAPNPVEAVATVRAGRALGRIAGGGPAVNPKIVALPRDLILAANTATLRDDIRRGTIGGLAGLGRGVFGDSPEVHLPEREILVASVTIYFPHPVTRVRVRLESDANVSAFGGSRLVASVVSLSGSEAALVAHDGWIDRVTITSIGPVSVRNVCTDAGEFGWKRFEQWNWRESVRNSLSAYAKESPVLTPGSYRLDIVTGWADEAVANSPTTWSTTSTDFQVGPPPGLGTGASDHYPNGGPLNNLATYVHQTLPAAGDRPVYRTYDVAVSFTHDYVSRLFLVNGTPITIGVVDSNKREVRPGSPNVWGSGPDLALTDVDKAWLGTLHGDGGTPCASIDVSTVTRTELATAGVGETLLRAQLHSGVVRAGGKDLYRFDFVTSNYGSFATHVTDFRVGPTVAVASVIDLTTAKTTLATAEANILAARNAASAAIAAARTGTPTKLQFDAETAARAALALARAGARSGRDTAMSSFFAAAALPATRPLPTRGVDVTAVGETLLVEAAEPLAWDRISLTVTRSNRVPLVRDTIEFPTADFGSPDVGSFVFRNRLWTTTAELWAKHDAVEARLPGSWTLTVEASSARSVEVRVRATSATTVVLSGLGEGVEPDKTVAVPAGAAVTVSLTATALTTFRVAGTGFAIEALTIVRPWVARRSEGPVRLCAAQLPTSTTDTGHRVELVAEADFDLAGWKVSWQPFDASTAPVQYHSFAAGTVRDGTVLWVNGGLASGIASSVIDSRFGGTIGVPNPAGAIYRLVDPSGVVVHELAALAGGTPMSVTVLPNGDFTRAVISPQTAGAIRGWWTLGFDYRRDVGITEPVLSVAGRTTIERAGIGFCW